MKQGIEIGDKKQNISDAALSTIYDAAKLYLDDNNIIKTEGLTIGSEYCISLDKLVEYGYLTSPIMDPVTRKEIPLTKYVYTKINPNEEYSSFALINTDCNNT